MRARRAELLVARLAVDRDFLIERTLLHAFARLFFTITTQWHTGVIKKKFLDIALAETVAMDGPHVFRTQHHQCFEGHAEPVTPHCR